MEPTNLTIEILKSIRDEVRVTNQRVDAMRDEMRESAFVLRGELHEGLGAVRVEIAAVREQQVHSEIRVATELGEREPAPYRVPQNAQSRGLRGSCSSVEPLVLVPLFSALSSGMLAAGAGRSSLDARLDLHWG